MLSSCRVLVNGALELCELDWMRPILWDFLIEVQGEGHILPVPLGD